MATFAHADEFSDWQKFRATKFAEMKVVHPDQDGRIAEIKAKTKAAIAAYVAPSKPTSGEAAVIWRTSAAPQLVFDAPFAPRLLAVPAGEFTMGSPTTETGRQATEAPRHRVRIAHALAVSMFPIVWGEYAWFIQDSSYQPKGACLLEGAATRAAALDWRKPGFPVKIVMPVTCISFEDATAYTKWLSKKTGKTYRLLSEAEYEYVDRAGSTTPYWWGDGEVCEHADGLDEDASVSTGSPPNACHDGFAFTAPVDAFKPNAFGLFATTGDVDSWTSDCWAATYADAPNDGSARTSGDCSQRVLRGGGWADTDLRSASRRHSPKSELSPEHGFRVAREL